MINKTDPGIHEVVKQVDEMVELLRSANAIASRGGEDTDWKRFSSSISKLGIGSITARTYRIIKDDDGTPLTISKFTGPL